MFLTAWKLNHFLPRHPHAHAIFAFMHISLNLLLSRPLSTSTHATVHYYESLSVQPKKNHPSQTSFMHYYSWLIASSFFNPSKLKLRTVKKFYTATHNKHLWLRILLHHIDWSYRHLLSLFYISTFILILFIYYTLLSLLNIIPTKPLK